MKFRVENMFPVFIVKDRYMGTYSGGSWTAFHAVEVPPGCMDDGVTCAEFWTAEQKANTGLGNTPNEALADLEEKWTLMHME